MYVELNSSEVNNLYALCGLELCLYYVYLYHRLPLLIFIDE